MQILLDACILYDGACEAAAQAPSSAGAAAPPLLPPLLVVITGRGPLRAQWCETLARRRMRHVSFHLAWLSPGQYAALLACADVGVSLHASSSGLDLPMKVSDMLGWCVHRTPAPSTNTHTHTPRLVHTAHSHTGLPHIYHVPLPSNYHTDRVACRTPTHTG